MAEQIRKTDRYQYELLEADEQTKPPVYPYQATSRPALPSGY